MRLACSLFAWMCLLGAVQARAGEPSPPPVGEGSAGAAQTPPPLPEASPPLPEASPPLPEASPPPLPGAGAESPASPKPSHRLAGLSSNSPGWAFALGYSVNLGFHGMSTGGRFGAWYWLPESGLNAFIAEIEAGTLMRGPSGGSRGLTLAAEYRAGTGVRHEFIPSAGPVAAFYVTAAPVMHLWGGGVMFGARVGTGVKFTVLDTELSVAVRYESYPLLGAGVEGLLITLAYGD